MNIVMNKLFFIRRFLNSIESKPGIKTKLKTLIDNGLLSVQNT